MKEMPPPVREHLKRGGTLLALLPDIHRGELLRAAVQSSSGPYSSVNIEELAARIGVNESDIRPLLTVATVVVSGIAHGEEPEKIVQVLDESKVFDTGAERAALLSLANAAKTQETKKDTDRNILGTAVLPSLAGFHTAIDLRVEMDAGKVKKSVPVIVAFLGTDLNDQRVWFQMTQLQAEHLKNDLEEALGSIRDLEQWAQHKGS